MKKVAFALIVIMVSLFSFTACTKANTQVETEEESSAEKSGVAAETTESSENNSEQEVIEAKPEKLNTTEFQSLPRVAEQVGFSFRAPEEFVSDGSQFRKFNISEEKQEINGMEFAEPYSLVTIYYEKGVTKEELRIFPYDGENMQSVTLNPICYVSVQEINGMDVYLSEYVLRMVSQDYEMTEEDQKFIDSGKGGLSCDGVTEGDVYFRSMYWIQDGIYYELSSQEPDIQIEEMKQKVIEIMNAELQ